MGVYFLCRMSIVEAEAQDSKVNEVGGKEVGVQNEPQAKSDSTR